MLSMLLTLFKFKNFLGAKICTYWGKSSIRNMQSPGTTYRQRAGTECARNKVIARQRTPELAAYKRKRIQESYAAGLLYTTPWHIPSGLGTYQAHTQSK